MKRIEFIAPVEAMRGNLSGHQNLLYAENDNKAYYGPVGSVNYARNYSPRFIGAKRAADGRKYFSVKTKTANHLTTKAKYAMALLGGTGAIVASILRNKTLTPYVEAYAQWLELQNLGNKKTFRETLSAWVRQGLANKSATIAFAGPRPVYSIQNPWISTQDQTTGAVISNDIVWKFAMELGPDDLKELLITYNGPAGNGIKVKTLKRTSQDWATQAVSSGINGRVAEVDGVVTMIQIVVPEGQQVQIGVGGASTLLQSVPVWTVDGEDETAVMPTDMPSTDYPYVAHAQA